MDELDADAGTFDWGFEADPGYFPQDHKAALGKPDQTVLGFLWDAKGDAPIGTIPIDAIFSPVHRVNYTVANARVGQRTDFDKLIDRHNQCEHRRVTDLTIDKGAHFDHRCSAYHRPSRT